VVAATIAELMKGRGSYELHRRACESHVHDVIITKEAPNYRIE
jgi:hypothetical protein